MSRSAKERLAALPEPDRVAWLAEQPLDILKGIRSGEWWWEGRPEQFPPHGDWFLWLILTGRGWGKAVGVGTAIGTPDTARSMLDPSTPIGFVRIGDLAPGDQVFDETGRPCTVLATYDRTPVRAYRLTFSDGATIDACDEHQWVTWTHSERKAFLRSGAADTSRFPADWPTWRTSAGTGPQIRTTQQVVDTLTSGARRDSNHCVPLAGPLQMPDAEVPVDPWVLGYWLGNGATTEGSLTTHAEDENGVRQACELAGLPCGNSYTAPPKAPVFTARGLRSALGRAGVLGDKRVPAAYLWASEAQREALLAGLMDSDGYAEASKVEFSSSRRVLADAVMHLARSLGQKPRLYEGRAMLNGVDHGPKYRVNWQPTRNPFRLPRKAAKVRLNDGAQGLRNHHRMIVAVEEIEPVPMRCITVDSPNEMFLAGEAMIPTHNTRTGAEWLVAQAMKHPLDRAGNTTDWLVIGETLQDTRTFCISGPSGIINVLRRRGYEEIRNGPPGEGQYTYVKAPKPIITLDKGQKIYFEGCDDEDTGRGYNAAGAWLDELAKWRYTDKVWREGIMLSVRADLVGDRPRVVVTTTPKPIKLLINWVRRCKAGDAGYKLTVASTFDNATNLSPVVLAEWRKEYEGTTAGRQELAGELLEEAEGALWTHDLISKHRMRTNLPNWTYTVVGMDPPGTGRGDEMGLVAVSRGTDGDDYVRADWSKKLAGRAAARRAWELFLAVDADVLVVEDNFGKQWTMTVMEDAYGEMREEGRFPPGGAIPLKAVTAKQGKRLRAEPYAMRYEQGRVHHAGVFVELEDQMATWVPDEDTDSPDRVDALVHAGMWLKGRERGRSSLAAPKGQMAGVTAPNFG